MLHFPPELSQMLMWEIPQPKNNGKYTLKQYDTFHCIQSLTDYFAFEIISHIYKTVVVQ